MKKDHAEGPERAGIPFQGRTERSQKCRRSVVRAVPNGSIERYKWAQYETENGTGGLHAERRTARGSQNGTGNHETRTAQGMGAGEHGTDKGNGE